ncbi:MAG: hypothetical protein ACUVWV_16630 [Thermodesulfobacteriota bacterium]
MVGWENGDKAEPSAGSAENQIPIFMARESEMRPMHQQDKSQPLTIQFGRELDMFLAKLVTKGIVLAAVVTIIAVVQILINGITNRHLFLLAGALLSGLALFGFVAVIVRDAEAGGPRKSVLSMLLGLGGFVPYLFGAYLCFYEGIWELVRLFNHFSVVALVAAVFYIFAGYMIVLAIYRVSEFGRAVDEGRIQIQKAT